MAEINNAHPSRDPANDDSLTGLLRGFAQKALQNTDDMLPAKIVAFDRTTNRATVQPMIKLLATNGEAISRAQLASVPVLQIGGGGFILNFNLKAGDLGWIKASDRDVSLYLQANGATQYQPNTLRLHSFEDGLFIPDVLTGYTINAEDAENAVLQSLDGSVRVALWSDRVKITAPLVVIDAAETHCTGDLLVDGTITGTVDVIAGTISGKTHVHGGVHTGSGSTGVPT